MVKNKTTIPSYSLEDTSDPNLKRFVDRMGNWKYYFLVKEKKFVKGVTHILALGYAKGPRFHEYLLSVSKEEAKKKLETAGDEGTRTHEAIRQLLDGSKVTMGTKYLNELTGRQEVLNPDEWDNLQGFKNFCDTYHPRIVAREYAVYSTFHDFAGTADALIVITVPAGDKVFDKKFWGKDVLVLIDWKTSAAIYDEYQAQTAAYLQSTLEMGLFSGFFRQFGGLTFTGVLRVGTRHKKLFEFEVWDEPQTTVNWMLFEAAKLIADKVEPTFEPEVVEIPTEFYVKIPKAVVERPKRVKKLIKTVNRKRHGSHNTPHVSSEEGAGQLEPCTALPATLVGPESHRATCSAPTCWRSRSS